MDSCSVKPIWFFHIPKTGGRFFYANSFRIAEQEMIISGRQYEGILHGYGHTSFKPLDTENIISFSLLRNPVARLISHWQHIYRNYLTEDFEADKKRLFDFLEQNPNSGIINYQTKFISYSGDSYIIDINEKELPLIIDNNLLSVAKERINKVNYLFRTEDVSHDITKFVLDVIRKELYIHPKTEYFRTVVHKLKNNNSKKMFNLLTDSEKNKLENYVKFDMEIYESANFYNIK